MYKDCFLKLHKNVDFAEVESRFIWNIIKIQSSSPFEKN